MAKIEPPSKEENLDGHCATDSASVRLDAYYPHYDKTCNHGHYSFERHGRRCSCGAWMVDFGD